MFRAYRFVGKLNGKYAEQQRRLITGAFQFIILSCEWFDVDAAELMANSTDLKTIWNWKKKKEKRCQDSRCCFKINFHDREMIVTEGANIKLSPFILFRTIHDRNKEGQSIFTFSHCKKKTKYPGHECCHVRVVKSSGFCTAATWQQSCGIKFIHTPDRLNQDGDQMSVMMFNFYSIK